MDDKSYANLLKAIQESVDPSGIRIDIKEITKNRNNEVILIIQNGPSNSEVLNKKLEKKVPKAKTLVLTNMKTLHIKGIHEIVTLKEI